MTVSGAGAVVYALKFKATYSPLAKRIVRSAVIRSRPIFVKRMLELLSQRHIADNNASSTSAQVKYEGSDHESTILMKR